MEKINLSKSKTTICPRCKGNGYFMIKESVEKPVNKVVQCTMCKSRGELDDPNDDIIIAANGIHQLH